MSRCNIINPISFPKVANPNLLNVLKDGRWAGERSAATFPFIRTTYTPYKNSTSSVQYNGETWFRPSQNFFETMQRKLTTLSLLPATTKERAFVIDGHIVYVIYGKTDRGPFIPLTEKLFEAMKIKLIEEFGTDDEKFLVFCNTTIENPLPFVNAMMGSNLVAGTLKPLIESFLSSKPTVKIFFCNMSILLAFLKTPDGRPTPLYDVIASGQPPPNDFKARTGLDYTEELGRYYDAEITRKTIEFCVDFYEKMFHRRPNPQNLLPILRSDGLVLRSDGTPAIIPGVDGNLDFITGLQPLSRSDGSPQVITVAEPQMPTRRIHPLEYYVQMTIDEIMNPPPLVAQPPLVPLVEVQPPLVPLVEVQPAINVDPIDDVIAPQPPLTARQKARRADHLASMALNERLHKIKIEQAKKFEAENIRRLQVDERTGVPSETRRLQQIEFAKTIQPVVVPFDHSIKLNEVEYNLNVRISSSGQIFELLSPPDYASPMLNYLAEKFPTTIQGLLGYVELQYEPILDSIHVDFFTIFSNRRDIRSLLTHDESVGLKGMGKKLLCFALRYFQTMYTAINDDTRIFLEAGGLAKFCEIRPYLEMTDEQLFEKLRNRPTIYADAKRNLSNNHQRLAEYVCDLESNERLVNYYRSFGFETDGTDYGHIMVKMSATFATVVGHCGIIPVQVQRDRAERDRAERDRAERDRAERERAERERAERELAEYRAERDRKDRELARQEMDDMDRRLGVDKPQPHIGEPSRRERVVGGAAERAVGGAAERAVGGAAERAVGGAAERVEIKENTWKYEDIEFEKVHNPQMCKLFENMRQIHVSKIYVPHGKPCESWNMGRKVGESGEAGSAWEVCKVGGVASCNYVVKKLSTLYPNALNPVEVLLQSKAASIGVAPKIFQVIYTQENWVYIVMEKLDSTLTQLITPDMSLELFKRYVTEIVALLQKLVAHRIQHDDLRDDNIMYNKEEKQFYIIDFGRSAICKNVKECCAADWRRLRLNLLHYCENVFEFSKGHKAEAFINAINPCINLA